MAITGRIKFFEQSKALFVRGATATASSNSDAAKNILSSNKYIKWSSLGSNDLTTETITIDFPSSKINRIFLITTNFKEFTIKYDVADIPTDFTNVLGLDGSLGSLAETDYSRDTAYYEFDEVTTSRIYITATKTQVVDEEKSLERFYCTYEIGTLEGIPEVSKEELNYNLNNQKVLSGNLNVQKRLETFATTIKFKNYPAIKNDYDVMLDLHRRPSSFLIWLCGGKYGEQFSIERTNWELKDVYNVQTVGKFSIRWNKNIYIAGYNGTVKLSQSTEII